ncbi:MAG TPA: biotin/lipoyl-binding protein, partial [Pirellulales bacterium]|nr:biotin/lipoyl-binding protein [Pirellulales bacterium]
MRLGRIRRWQLAVVTSGAILLAFLSFRLIQQGPPTVLAGDSAAERPADNTPGSATQSQLEVLVARPETGGLQRSTTLPGTVIAFESAQLYAKVSGYLRSQAVDIGDTVQRGQVLAEIDSPETLKALDQAKAAQDQAEAQVSQADARITTAAADEEAAVA